MVKVKRIKEKLERRSDSFSLFFFFFFFFFFPRKKGPSLKSKGKSDPLECAIRLIVVQRTSKPRMDSSAVARFFLFHSSKHCRPSRRRFFFFFFSFVRSPSDEALSRLPESVSGPRRASFSYCYNRYPRERFFSPRSTFALTTRPFTLLNSRFYPVCSLHRSPLCRVIRYLLAWSRRMVNLHSLRLSAFRLFRIYIYIYIYIYMYVYIVISRQ